METDVLRALLVLRNAGHTASYTADRRFVVDGEVYTLYEFLALAEATTTPKILF